MIILPEEYRYTINGIARTIDLFVEFNNSKDIDHVNKPWKAPYFCLKRYDYTWNGFTYTSFKRLYMETTDPTEYEAAMYILGSWSAWKRLQASHKMRKTFQEMRDEMEIRIRSEAMRTITNMATNKDASGLSAAKYISDRKWEKVIAPHRIKTDREKQKLNAVSKVVDDDIKRLGLVFDTVGDK